MGAESEGNKLSLEGLAQKLETQTQRLEALEQENAELRREVAELKGSDTARAVQEQEPAGSSSQRRVSRSWLLRNAGAAAVGTMAAGALLGRDASVAKANHLDPGISVDWVVAHNEGADSSAVFGVAPNGRGVTGSGETGVSGLSSATGFSGVSGTHNGSFGFGVVGDGKGEAGAGVLGRNSDGTGVWGQSSKSGYGGVTAEHTGTVGFGVIGLGKGATGAGVLGRSSSGIGVQGEGNNGVHGKATGGYGGLFEGGKAQLKIVPKGSVGKPTSGAHTKGEIYMDSTGALFVCTAGGTPGTWRKVTTTAA